MKNDSTVQAGRVVSIEYTLRDDRGEVVDSNVGASPLEYLHGHGEIVAGLETRLDAASVGDEAAVVVAPQDGYGEHDPSRVYTVPRDRIGFAVAPGDVVQAERPGGVTVPLMVVGVTDDEVTVDANHPLAGRTLHFHVRVVGVRDATDEDRARRSAH